MVRETPATGEVLVAQVPGGAREVLVAQAPGRAGEVLAAQAALSLSLFLSQPSIYLT
jgi:hypothetical protein